MIRPAWFIGCCIDKRSCSEVGLQCCDGIMKRRHDKKQRPHLCAVCDKKFARKQNLVYHSERHAATNVYPCTQCEKKFPNQHCLRTHMNGHSSKYECIECGKCCQEKAALKAH